MIQHNIIQPPQNVNNKSGHLEAQKKFNSHHLRYVTIIMCDGTQSIYKKCVFI